jgi:hypothetical protein
MTRRCGLAAPLVLLPSAAPVAAKTHLCDFPRQSARDRIPPQTAIATRGDGFVVSNAITEGIAGGPVPARIARDNDRALTFTSEVEVDRRDVGANIRGLLYRMVIQEAGGAATMPMQPTGTQQSLTGRGRCALRP